MGQVSRVKCQVYLKSIIFILTCLLLLAETFSVPLPLASVENRVTLNPAYHWLAEQPGPIALVELPLHSAPAPEFPEVKRLYASSLGWWKLVNGYSGYTPPRQPQLAQALATFPDSNSITTLQNLTLLSQASLQPSNPPTLQPSNPPLFLLVHPGEASFDRTHWETTTRWQAERNPALLPLNQFEGDYLYQIIPPDPTRFATPVATFGLNQTIHLLAYDLSIPNLQLTKPDSLSDSTLHASRFRAKPPPGTLHASRLILYWQSTAPLLTDTTIFIHLRAPDGFIRSQADGPPVSGHYPTTTWQPGEIIQDIHLLPTDDLTQIDHLAIGLYETSTGERLPAFAPNGESLAEDALIIPLHP
jgi:hypothetical protein